MSGSFVLLIASRVLDGMAGDWLSLGHTLTAAALMSGPYKGLNSVQQIMADTFGRPGLSAECSRGRLFGR